MKKIYLLNLDTETCNTIMRNGKLDMSDTLVYDIGWAVIDLHGNTYATRSYIVDEIFTHEKDLMKSAYYAKKLPQYYADINEGKRKVASFYEIRAQFIKDMQDYNTKIVCCHNTRFDKNALTVSQRYITKSKWRYFFPYDTEFWDTMKMANDVVAPMKKYIAFCEKNGYMTKHKKPRPKLTAEVLYRFITQDNNFDEAHTAFEDVEIEKQILWYCFGKHKRMRRALYEKGATM